MKRGLIIHFTDVNAKTTLASARIAKYLSSKFDWPIADAKNREPIDNYYDVTMLVSSPSAFVDPEWRQLVADCIARSGTYIFASNDFSTTQAGQIYVTFDRFGRKRERIIWTNMPHQMLTPADTYVNWNWLTYDRHAEQPPKMYDGLVYWGACRPQRVGYLTKWFGNEAPYPRWVSTTARATSNWKKFCYPTVEFFEPFLDISTIGQFDATIYLEDTSIHKKYNSPANRFYEALSYRLPIFFDPSCRNTFREQWGNPKYDIESYIVRTIDDVARLLEQTVEIAAAQRAWRQPYRKWLDQSVEEAGRKAQIL